MNFIPKEKVASFLLGIFRTVLEFIVSLMDVYDLMNKLLTFMTIRPCLFLLFNPLSIPVMYCDQYNSPCPSIKLFTLCFCHQQSSLLLLLLSGRATHTIKTILGVQIYKAQCTHHGYPSDKHTLATYITVVCVQNGDLPTLMLPIFLRLIK